MMGRGEARAVEALGRTERGRLETDNIRYNLHFFLGPFHRVLEDWRFPRIGVNDVWRQWWIGDTVRNIPPLRKLDAADLQFLDKLPLTRTEMHGRKIGSRRRPARKTMCDLRYLMEYIIVKVDAAGVREEHISLESVDRMFLCVADEFQSGRNAQKKWLTVSDRVRSDLRRLEATHDDPGG